MTALGEWFTATFHHLDYVKKAVRIGVTQHIERPRPDKFPVELEVACSLVPRDSREKNRFPGPKFYFSGTISNASELQAFLETEIELLEFSVEPGYQIEFWWHLVFGKEYKLRLREIEKQERGVPFKPYTGYGFRERLDRRLRCLE
ncbi:uncharacterized protein LOC100902115 [Galendromus occidentalis]|uniref:Uncharacterized protein LOC100902115 n=1 Tax=Galendromus occidentalis TaxID=34638 RepID=A0AAJ6QQV9_9ACAR|nr:uncharacterized protein LOC100902115 [Galendromus occidentalis]